VRAGIVPGMSAEVLTRRQFASDNYSGICQEAFTAMTEANRGHEVGYGNDTWTAKAADLIREVFETDCEAFFAFRPFCPCRRGPQPRLRRHARPKNFLKFMKIVFAFRCAGDKYAFIGSYGWS
jgi:hypothetical protein